MQCENAYRVGQLYCHIIITPQCRNIATRIVTVRYNDLEKLRYDLCADCAKALTADARRRGYKVTNRAKRS